MSNPSTPNGPRAFRFGILYMSKVTSGTSFLDQARKIEAQGFSTLLFSDHFERSPLAPIPAMAAAAMATNQIHVGTLVLCNDFRHPAVLAKEALTLELVAPGRIELGIGAGWMNQDYDQSGIANERPGIRIARLEEAIDILRQQIDNKTTSHTGTYYSIADMPAIPATPQANRMPILVGGAGRRLLSLAARTADIVGLNWNVRAGVVGNDAISSGISEATDEKLAWIREAAGERFASIELHAQCYLLSITDRPIEAIERWLASLGVDLDPASMLDSPHVLVGPLDQITDKILERRERWGISYLSFYDNHLGDATQIVDRLSGQ